jgi:hypothetical protein
VGEALTVCATHAKARTMKEENCMMMIERLIFTGGKFECGLTVKIWRGGTRPL